MGNYTIFRCSKILGESGKQEIYNKCSENYRSQIVFRTDIFRKLTLGAPVAGVAWWFWLDALNNLGGRGQRNRVEIARSRFCGLVAE